MTDFMNLKSIKSKENINILALKKLLLKKKEKKKDPRNFFKDSLNVSLLSGKKFNELNPKMASYVSHLKDSSIFLDSVRTKQFLQLAKYILKKNIEHRKTVLLVGTSNYSTVFTSRKVKKSNPFFVSPRWVGGTLTNWSTLQNRLQKFRSLELQEIEGKFQTISKKELSRKQKLLKKLRSFYVGIKNMKHLPDLVIFFNSTKDHLGILECNKMGIPVIAGINTNYNLDLIPYPILMNIESKESVHFFLRNLFVKNSFSNYFSKIKNYSSKVKIKPYQTCSQKNRCKLLKSLVFS